ncbi:hypothetical protein HN827_03385 [archaeon]|nr:hypothetical protein [archaeon]MBT7391845.1 hypothetical protein [archaeon]
MKRTTIVVFILFCTLIISSIVLAQLDNSSSSSIDLKNTLNLTNETKFSNKTLNSTIRINNSGLILYTSKLVYDIDEGIEIHLNVTNKTDARLELITQNTRYYYLNPPEKLEFYPRHIGNYSIELYRKGILLTNYNFVVTVNEKELNNNSQINNSLNDPEIIIEKSYFNLSETINISVDSGKYNLSKVRIAIKSPFKTYVLLGISSKKLLFFPKNIGRHIIELIHEGEIIKQKLIYVVTSSF